MSGWGIKKGLKSFGHVDRVTLAGDDLGSPNTNASIEQRFLSSGAIMHDVWTTVNFSFVTTVLNTDASVTLAGGPAAYVIVYNPSSTATVYVNFNAAAVKPVAATTAGSFPLLPSSFLEIGILATTVHVISATASIDVHITSFT